MTNYCGKMIAPDADGTYTLAAGETYTCSASHADYEPEETNPTMLLFLKLYLRKFTVTATAGENGTIPPRVKPRTTIRAIEAIFEKTAE